MKNKLDVLIPQEKSVTLAGKEYTVKKLGFRQIIKILRFVSTLQDDVRARILKNVNEGHNDFGAMIEAMADENLPEFLSIILNVNGESKKHLSTIDDIEEMANLVLALTEVNNFDKILKTFQKAAGNMKGITEILRKSNSLPSLQK